MSNIDMTAIVSEDAEKINQAYQAATPKEEYKPEFNVVEVNEWQVRSKPDQWNKKGYCYASFETQEEAEKYAYNQKLIAQLQEEIRKLSNAQDGNAIGYTSDFDYDY